jgi:acyl-CoA synthetase (AMP-forming)/AMP-acid ligase II
VHFVLVERTRVTTSTPESPGIPARNGFNSVCRALPGDRAVLPPSPADKCKSSQQGRGALADFKVPREIRFVDEMPRSTLEKVAKAELRKMLG